MNTADLATLTLRGHTYQDIRVKRLRYADERPAISLDIWSAEWNEWEPFTTGSVNLIPQGHEPADGCVFIRDYNENVGLADQLAAAGLCERTGRTVRFGMNCQAVEVRLIGALA